MNDLVLYHVPEIAMPEETEDVRDLTLITGGCVLCRTNENQKLEVITLANPAALHTNLADRHVQALWTCIGSSPELMGAFAGVAMAAAQAFTELGNIKGIEDGTMDADDLHELARIKGDDAIAPAKLERVEPGRRGKEKKEKGRKRGR